MTVEVLNKVNSINASLIFFLLSYSNGTTILFGYRVESSTTKVLPQYMRYHHGSPQVVVLCNSITGKTPRQLLDGSERNQHSKKVAKSHLKSRFYMYMVTWPVSVSHPSDSSSFRWTSDIAAGKTF